MSTGPVQVIYFVDSTEAGGAEEYMYLLLAELDPARYRPVLVTTGHPALERLARRIAERGIKVDERGPRWGTLTPLRYLRAVRGLIRRYRADIVHVNQQWPYACAHFVVAAFLAGASVVLSTCHLPILDERRHNWRGELLGSLSQACLASVVVESEANRDLAIERHGWDPVRVIVIPYGIEVRRFATATADGVREELGVRPDAKLVGTVGRLTKQKALHVFLDAAARLARVRSDVAFVIVGDGPERAMLEARASHLAIGDRVVFAGRRADVPRLLAALDIFTLTSDYEGMPFAILEAMAAGKPVVATDVGGVRDAVVSGTTGVLVPAGDLGAFAAAVSKLLCDPAQAAAMGRAGQQRARGLFEVERMAQETMRLYQRLLLPASRTGRQNQKLPGEARS